jgi:IclR family mhp operon transcriptional activator
MELCETNRARSYFMVRRDKLGFKINMLRSAVGRAYLAYCADDEREEILAELRSSARKGDAIAKSPRMIQALLTETRRLGYGTREASFGGDYDRPKSEYNDGLAALAVPILTEDERVLGCINIVWVERLFKAADMADKHLKDLQQTAKRIAKKMS